MDVKKVTLDYDRFRVTFLLLKKIGKQDFEMEISIDVVFGILIVFLLALVWGVVHYIKKEEEIGR